MTFASATDTFLRPEMNFWDAFSMTMKGALYSGQRYGQRKAVLTLFFHNFLSSLFLKIFSPSSPLIQAP